MIRKLLLPVLAAGLLGGCATGYTYRGGVGDYYYGRPSVQYRYYGSPYGYYGYPGYGYSPYGYSRTWSYWNYYYGYPYYYGRVWYPYRPPHRHDHGGGDHDHTRNDHGGGGGPGQDHDDDDNNSDQGGGTATDRPPVTHRPPHRPRPPWRDIGTGKGRDDPGFERPVLPIGDPTTRPVRPILPRTSVLPSRPYRPVVVPRPAGRSTQTRHVSPSLPALPASSGSQDRDRRRIHKP